MSEPGVLTALLDDPTVRGLVGDAALARAMVEVEIALARAAAATGRVPPEAAERIRTVLADHTPDLADLAAGTASAGVPIPALLGRLRDEVGEPAADALHLGATSQDVVDTALVLQLRAALEVLDQRLLALVAALHALVRAHAGTPMLARTRYQQAVPTTFGLKAAGWLDPLLDHRDRLLPLRERLLVVQLGGAAGNLAAYGAEGPAVVEALARELGLGVPTLPWHAQRERVVELGAWLALVTGTLGKLGQDVLLLVQSEVGEVRVTAGGASSAMPQKANPVQAEALVTLARRAATLAGGLFQALVHAHERDGAAWQLEWVFLPDLVVTAATALRHGRELVAGLVVDTERMRTNLAATRGLALAEAATVALARTMPRAEARALVEAACREVRAGGPDLLERLAARAPASVDWAAVRRAAERPAAAGPLAARVLARAERALAG